MTQITTTTMGMFNTLFKSVPDSVPDLQWSHRRVQFNSFRTVDRDLSPICFEHNVGDVKISVYTSCVPEFADLSAIRSDGVEMPYYLIGTARSHFDYKDKNFKFGKVGAIFVVVETNGLIVFCKPLKYKGHIADRIKSRNVGGSSVVTRFNQLIVEALQSADVKCSMKLTA